MYENDINRIHRAYVVRSWFDEHERSIHHKHGPSQSPDANPIENVWDELLRTFRGPSPPPNTLTNLGEICSNDGQNYW